MKSNKAVLVKRNHLKKSLIMILCTLLGVMLMLSSCGGRAEEETTTTVADPEFDEETERRLSTVTIGDDSFMLPCAVSEFTEKGYVWQVNGKPVDMKGILVPGKTTMDRLHISRGGDEQNEVSIKNTCAESAILRDCIVYHFCYTNWDVKYGYGGCDSQNWEYMGISSESDYYDVMSAFEGILEFREDSSSDGFYVQYRDANRFISFYFNSSGDIMTHMSVAVYPEMEGQSSGEISIY